MTDELKVTANEPPVLQKIEGLLHDRFTRYSTAEGPGVVGFDFTILIPIVIQLISEVLGKCLNKDDEEDVMQRMAKPNLMQRAILKVYSRRLLREEGLYDDNRKLVGVVANATVSLCDQCDETDRQQLVDYINDELADYTLI